MFGAASATPLLSPQEADFKELRQELLDVENTGLWKAYMNQRTHAKDVRLIPYFIERIKHYQSSLSKSYAVARDGDCEVTWGKTTLSDGMSAMKREFNECLTGRLLGLSEHLVAKLPFDEVDELDMPQDPPVSAYDQQENFIQLMEGVFAKFPIFVMLAMEMQAILQSLVDTASTVQQKVLASVMSVAISVGPILATMAQGYLEEQGFLPKFLEEQKES